MLIFKQCRKSDSKPTKNPTPIFPPPLSHTHTRTNVNFRRPPTESVQRQGRRRRCSHLHHQASVPQLPYMANPSINSPTFSLQNPSSFPLYWKPLFSQFSIPSLLRFLPLIAPHPLRLALLRIISASSAVCYPFRNVAFLHSTHIRFRR